MQLVELTNTEWTLIGNNVSDITFQVLGGNPVYINFNSTNAPPAEEFGLIYDHRNGELKKDVTEMTYKPTPNYVFARSVTRQATIVVETA